MKLSVLIPTRDMSCHSLVLALYEQLKASCLECWEIVVCDDGSENIEAKESFDQVNDLSGVRVEIMEKSRNRGAMRNRLPGLARYGWILEVNSNVMPASDDFIQRYIEEAEKSYDVVCGGIISSDIKGNLRSMDENDFAKRHNSESRNMNPFRSFRNTNVLARREVYDRVCYDESIGEYGYEDLAFGVALQQAGVTVRYIDNPVKYIQEESNVAYVEKTETALRTLKGMSAEQQSQSVLHQWAEKLRVCKLSKVIRLWHRLFSGIERSNLCGRQPRLWVFRIYKLGYYMSLP